MDMRNNTIVATINNTPVVQFDNIYSSNIGTGVNAELLEQIIADEPVEGDFCLLPPYCLIEEKHKYLAS